MCHCSLDAKFCILKEFYHHTTRFFWKNLLFSFLPKYVSRLVHLSIHTRSLYFSWCFYAAGANFLRFEIPKLLSQQYQQFHFRDFTRLFWKINGIKNCIRYNTFGTWLDVRQDSPCSAHFWTLKTPPIGLKISQDILQGTSNKGQNELVCHTQTFWPLEVIKGHLVK